MPQPQLTIVDDDDNMRLVLRCLVEIALPSAHVDDLSSGEGALRHIEQEGTDLLITDCNMPGMDGPTLVKLLRKEKPHLKIIMISGSQEARSLSEAAGADRFVEKRYMNVDLPSAVRALMGKG